MRKLVVVVLAVASMLVVGASAAGAAHQRDCKHSETIQGRLCITLDGKPFKEYRVHVEIRYEEPRNLYFPTPVKRSTWAASVVCRPRQTHIDTLHFYAADGAEVPVSAEQEVTVAKGLQPSLDQIANMGCRRRS